MATISMLMDISSGSGQDASTQKTISSANWFYLSVTCTCRPMLH
jgi:hypothetical protein